MRLIAAGVLLAWAGPLLADDDALEVVRRLGDPEWEVREEAARELEARGMAALPLLEELLEHPDEEVRGRAWRILDDLHLEADPMRRAAWISGYPVAREVARRWDLLRKRLVAALPPGPEDWAERELERLERIPEHEPRRLGHDELIGALARALERALERTASAARCHRALREAPSGPSWVDLLDQACREGRLGGQAFEDLAIFLLEPEVAPWEGDFGDEAGWRTAFELLLDFEEGRNVGGEPARTWPEALDAVASREVFANLRIWAAGWRAGKGEMVEVEELRSIRELELEQVRRHDAIAVELAATTSLLELRDRARRGAKPYRAGLRLAEALGPPDLGDQRRRSWLREASELAGAPPGEEDLAGALLARLDQD